ncbi:MAG: GtrA family protein [Bdellovibrionota bacterium]
MAALPDPTEIRPSFVGILKRFIESHKRSFSRAAFTAFAATVVDFLSLYCLVEFLGVYYVIATAIAALLGAIANFLLNKYWAFEHRHGRIYAQGFRYTIVAAGSLVLNTLFVFLFTEFAQLSYLMSKAVVSLAVGWGWNYPLHRYFVFPPRPRT